MVTERLLQAHEEERTIKYGMDEDSPNNGEQHDKDVPPSKSKSKSMPKPKPKPRGKGKGKGKQAVVTSDDNNSDALVESSKRSSKKSPQKSRENMLAGAKSKSKNGNTGNVTSPEARLAKRTQTMEELPPQPSLSPPFVPPPANPELVMPEASLSVIPDFSALALTVPSNNNTSSGSVPLDNLPFDSPSLDPPYVPTSPILSQIWVEDDSRGPQPPFTQVSKRKLTVTARDKLDGKRVRRNSKSSNHEELPSDKEDLFYSSQRLQPRKQAVASTSNTGQKLIIYFVYIYSHS